MTLHEFFGFLSSVLALVGLVPTLRGIRRGQVHPHMFSWLIWSILLGVVAVAQISGGAGAGAWNSVAALLCCALIAGLSLKYGEKHITRADWVALVCALSAIPLWMATNNPLWSVLLVSFIDCVAYVPTFRKSWHRPWSEAAMSYVLGAAAFALSLAALEQVSFVTAFYPFCIACANIAFVAMVFVRRRAVPVA